MSKAKCRSCVLGHRDPDIRQLERSSPTPQTSSIYTFLFVAGVFQREVTLGDLKSAFMQSDKDVSERSQGQLYASLPPGGIPLADGTWVEEGSLVQLNAARLRHIGLENCGHGLAARPRESASEIFLNELLSLFRYPPKSGRALLSGTLPLRYCAARFAYSTPTWRLPVSGHVDRLIAAHSDAAGICGDEVFGLRVHSLSGSGPVRKRFRLNRKTPAHLAGLLIHSRPRVWKRLRQNGFFRFFIA